MSKVTTEYSPREYDFIYRQEALDICENVFGETKLKLVLNKNVYRNRALWKWKMNRDHSQRCL